MQKLFHYISFVRIRVLEKRSVRDDVDWWVLGIGTQAGSHLAPGLPGTGLQDPAKEHVRHGAPSSVAALLAHNLSDLVQQYHGHGAPLDNYRVKAIKVRYAARSLHEPTLAVSILERKHAHVDKQAAVAVLGQTSQALDARDVELAQLDNDFEYRPSEPLRKLVERNQMLRAQPLTLVILEPS
ncbi:hypothetical protein FBU31_007203 [Coemansia sp. 'formosensis']|nr:hypothetical protein FBU31_007203 [Coemansia sp. 'formosensis']